ncbi:MAG TPA: NADP-dependent oxidoreductase [Galbitalea sp.]|jgi:NADPH:quinone reductase-like Zn-dependent oxidoreductase
MSKAVRFDRYGGAEVLQVVEVDDRPPGPGEVRVSVRAAGINPGEIPIREGAMHERFPAKFPSGQGSDFAGVIAEIGDRVDGVSVGDEVIGFSDERSAQAESVTIAADRVIPKPHGADWNQAGCLYIAGTTARASIVATRVRRGDTVVVAGAAGGVGIVTTQLAVLAGAAVVATASKENHAYLERLGAIPVEYGKGLADRIRKIVPDGVDAFIDTHGDGNVEVAVALGVDRDRINTIADFAARKKYGVRGEGMSTVPARETLIELARLLGNGDLVIPILATYPLEQVRAAYERLAKRHGLGKIVLEVNTNT